MAEYKLDVTRRESRARSKRLRELGGSGGSVGSTVVQINGGSASGGNTHEHANLSTLDKLNDDEAGYVYLNQLRQVERGDGRRVWQTVQEKSKAGWADESGHSAESDHALNADESLHSAESDHALTADDSERWNGEHFGDWLDQPVRKGDAVEFEQVQSDTIRSSSDFMDGLFGSGFKIWTDENGITHLTIDRLTVRQTMTVLELLVEKVRSVGGQLVVSAANGKIKTIQENDDSYIITFEQENTFVAHDLIRCQTFTGAGVKGYWVEVSDVSGSGIEIPKSEFAEWDCVPEAGDECVLMGNTESPSRQNLILISATEDGKPRVDVMDGVSAKNFTGCLRARLGNLDGIEDDHFPENNQPHGNGLYSDNAYLKGTFILATGEDVRTKFEITEGKIQSSVGALRQDVTLDKGFLNNPSFYEGRSKWQTESDAVFWLAGEKNIWVNGKLLTKKGDGASVTQDMNRTVIHIRNKYILQKHEHLYVEPEITTNGAGQKEAKPVYLNFYYRCAQAGTLTVEFLNVDNTGFASYESLHVVENIGVTEGYRQYKCSGLWNGTGDFRLSFTGDIYLYMLTLSTDKVEELSHRYRTLFEQSEKVVRIAAENFDNTGHVLAGSEIISTSKYNALISERFNGDGSLKNVSGLVTTESFASMFASAVTADSNIVKRADISAFVTKDANGNLESGIHIGANQIALEGLVTANQNFKILNDGSMEATNGTFRGRIEATSGTFVGSSNLYELRIDADTKKIVIKGPERIVSERDFSPFSGTTSYEYMSIGEYVWTAGRGYADGIALECLIAPQIRMKAPFGEAPNNGYWYFNMDPYNGLVCGYRTYQNESTPMNQTVISPQGHVIYASNLKLQGLPTDPSWCFDGQVYRDGNTLKIKTT